VYDKKNTTYFVTLSLLLALFLSLTLDSSSQENYKGELLKASFVKSEIFQKAGELSFNVVRIYNYSDNAINILPILDVPDGWAIFSSAFTDTVIPPNSDISLPFRFRTPSTAKSDIEHIVSFKALSANKNIFIESSFVVKLESFHNWDVIIPEKRVFFYPRMNLARFDIIIVNNGNTNELISLDIKPDSKIKLECLSSSDFRPEINLAPNSDTTLCFTAAYVYSEDRVFDVSKVQIHATDGKIKIFRAVLIEKYSDTYAPFEIDRNLAHETEAGVRTFSKSNEVLPFIKARGSAAFKNESSFNYNFTYYDLTETEDFISNSYYNFLYTRNSFNAGLGAFSSQLGRNLYSRNSLMVSNIIKLSSTASIEAYASYNLLSPKTSLAAGYYLNNKNINMLGSVSYDVDGANKVNTASAILNTGRIPLAKNNELSAILYGYHESHYFANKYQQLGYAWDINYFGKITRNLSFHFTNNYGSPNISGPQMGLVNFSTKVKYNISETKDYLSAQYLNSSRNYYNVNSEGYRMPEIMLKDQYANILFHSNTNKKFRWYMGPSVEFYNSSTPIPNQDERAIYNIQKYRMEIKCFFGRNLMMHIKYGLGKFSYEEIENLTDSRYDFHLLGDYHYSGYGLRFSYDYGPMVNMGLYQYALDAGNNSVNISPYIIKTYLKGRVSLSMFANYAYRFDLKYGSLNINPKIETYVFKDWYFVVSGTYNYTQQSYHEFDSRRSFYYMEFSIKKRWGKSDNNKWKKNLRRLKIQLFKDENGNGKQDDYEKGIPNTKIRLQITNSATQNNRGNFPIDITLLSNDKGIVIFNQIPKGFYKVTIIPIDDLKEYFYVNKSAEQIELNKNSVYSIPFQKASKIKGWIDLKREKFTKDSKIKTDIANIKVTAFNKLGNSYSAFTHKDGSFTIFAPGNHIYQIRMKNVFGKNFRILKNDIQLLLVDTTSAPIVFKIVEQNRKINFKKASPTNKSTDSPVLQKIKVLQGTIYNDSDQKPVPKDGIPNFNLPKMTLETNKMISGRYYLIAGHINNFKDAEKLMQILHEQGIKSYLGAIEKQELYYVYLEFTNSRAEAKQKLANYKKAEIKPITIIKFEEK
jgi:hypothetical protein